MALINGEGYYAQRESAVDFTGKLYSQQRDHSYLDHLYSVNFKKKRDSIVTLIKNQAFMRLIAHMSRAK
jgi:hypothetical protein